LGVEIVILNGEDDYSAMGEKEYLRANEGEFEDIVLAVNLDGAGYHAADTAYSLYDCPPSIAGLIRAEFSDRAGFIEGEPWYQSDHSLFLMQGTPALAITSADFTQLWTQIAHTSDDLPDLVDPLILIEIASALHEIILKLA
jgi:aminopeptidase YwaD